MMVPTHDELPKRRLGFRLVAVENVGVFPMGKEIVREVCVRGDMQISCMYVPGYIYVSVFLLLSLNSFKVLGL